MLYLLDGLRAGSLVLLLVTSVGAMPLAEAQPDPDRRGAQLPLLSGGAAFGGLGAPARTSSQIRRPRVAVGPGGVFAIAYESFVVGDPVDEWRVAVARFATDGTPLGAPVVFEPEDGCFGADVWSNDNQLDADLAFGPDGTLYVAMTHSGLRDLIGSFSQSAETALGAIRPDGQVANLNPRRDRCLQYKPFLDGLLMTQPRLALTTRDLLLVQQGYFYLPDGSGPEVHNSGLHMVVDGAAVPFTQQTVETVPQVILHEADPLSRTEIHEAPDVATSGDAALFVWQRCPYRFEVDGMDVIVRYLSCQVAARRATVAGGAVQLEGAEVVVSEPGGSYSYAPSVAANAAGQRVVAWADTRTGGIEVFAQRLDAAGRLIGSNVRVSQGDGVLTTRPAVAIRPDGAFAVAWSDSSAAGLRARVQRFDADARPLGPTTTLGTGETGAPDLAATADDYLLVWLGADADGRLSLYSSIDGQPVDAEPGSDFPAARLEAYPSPARGRATLTFGLAAPADIRLAVYDLLGRPVRRLDGPRPAGTHAVGIDLQGWAPGTYLVRLRTGGRVETRRLTVVR